MTEQQTRPPQTPLTRHDLAKALLDSGLIARYQDYALRAHPTTMQLEEPEEVALGWAGGILAALARHGGRR